MAEIVVSAVVSVLVEKLFSGDLMNLARSEGIHSQLKKWKDDLPLIQAVLADAGQKQISDTSVELWLHKLHDLAYDIDDVLDDLATEAIRHKLNQESRASTSTGKVMMKMIPTCCTNFTPRYIKYGRNMSSKLDELSEKLQDLVNQRTNLGLEVNVVRPNRNNTRLEETSLVDESKIMGREGDKEALIRKLLGNEACNVNVSIVSIVGMGGIGKTTLAQLLYNDDRVKNHFEHRAWVCVSEEMDVFKISKAIFQAVTNDDKSFANLDLLHVALKEALSNKRFLVVLDDVWNEDRKKWDLLQRPFFAGAPGSKVIVTTRKTTVATMMDSVEAYDLELLSPEKALSLFAQSELGKQDFEQHPTFKSHAEGIVKKCGGLPLALTALGRVLNRKTTEAEWEELLNSKIWELRDENGILPALRLSYNDLPSHLKQLFTYCSLIPKDYVFGENELVVLWMAEGFLSKSNGSMSMERLGHECFEELKSRSFFQHSTHDKSQYAMHDLINDLALSVSREFFFMFDENNMDSYDGNQAFEMLRHFSFIGSEDGAYRKFKELQKATRMRTFLPMHVEYRRKISLSNADLDELLPRLRFLRVLSLAHCSITEIPKSIGDLKHMRYLNFSNTEITCLPEQVSDLYNLQSLLLSGCWYLCSLPVSFAKLKNLRHLDISDTPDLEKMPIGIGGLSSLQTLSRAIIEEGTDGFKVCELKDLSDLQGRLSIEGLHNVTDAVQAKDANLQQKTGIDELVLAWSHVFDYSRNATTEYQVLNELRPPHQMLRKLEVNFYGGMEFPSWVKSPSFNQLTKLIFKGLKKCMNLPTLGHLPSLEELKFDDLECWEKWTTGGVDTDGNATSFRCLRRISIKRCPKLVEVSIPFPSLEELEFDDLECLEKWSTGGGDTDGNATLFSRLRKIRIWDCPKLAQVSVGLMPSLRDLEIHGCSETVLKSLIRVSWSVLKLEIWGCEGPIHLDGEDLKHLQAVEDVSIIDCDGLRYLWESESEACKFLVRLRKLAVWQCSNLVSFEEKKEVPHQHLQSLKSLEVLCINDCPSMDYSFPCGVWPPNLRELEIGRLQRPMGEWGHQNYPSSLVHLTLHGHNSGVVSFAVESNSNNNSNININTTSSSSSSFLLPSSLKYLSIFYFMDVESVAEVLRHLTCLEKLNIRYCPKLKDVPKTTSSLRVDRWEVE